MFSFKTFNSKNGNTALATLDFFFLSCVSGLRVSLCPPSMDESLEITLSA